MTLQVGDHPDDGEKIGSHVRSLADLLVDFFRELRRQDFHQGCECQLPHRILLDGTSW